MQRLVMEGCHCQRPVAPSFHRTSDVVSARTFGFPSCFHVGAQHALVVLAEIAEAGAHGSPPQNRTATTSALSVHLSPRARSCLAISSGAAPRTTEVGVSTRTPSVANTTHLPRAPGSVPAL